MADTTALRLERLSLINNVNDSRCSIRCGGSLLWVNSRFPKSRPRRDEAFAIVDARRVKDLRSWPLLHDPAAAHHGGGIGDQAHHGKIVADHDQSEVAIGAQLLK
jgi:hypothetical protein